MAEIDEVDQEQADQFEKQLAALLVILVLMHDPQEQDEQVWEQQVAASVGGFVRQNLQRIALAALIAMGISSLRAPKMANDISREYAPKVLSQLAKDSSNLDEYIEGIGSGEIAYGPGSRSGDPESHSEPDRRMERYQRTQVGSQGLARKTATGAREAIRSRLAKMAGATHKTWRTRRDSKVRPSHGGLESETIPIDSSWRTYQGDSLRFPGDPTSPPRAHRNCRCRAAFLIPQDQLSKNSRTLGDPHHRDVVYQDVPR